MGSDDVVAFAPPPTVDRVRLEALRYAVNDEAVTYVAIMRTFTSGLAGLLSDQSAAEVTSALLAHGVEIDADTADDRLRYLVERGNLALSPRETEARSIRDYLATRARYQLTQRGELVHRQVEELLGSTEAAREVSSEMLGAILDGVRALGVYDAARLAVTPPDRVARDATTVMAQFERLVESTRGFYTYLGEVLSRYDLDRAELQAFKDLLIDYLQRFVDEVLRHEPLVADALAALHAGPLDAVLARAAEGTRLAGVDGRAAVRAPGLRRPDWESMRVWFAGDRARQSDASQVRALATRAMSTLLVNLRRIAGTGEAEQSRYRDLLRLAAWFEAAGPDEAHALWAAAFGLYAPRHLGFGAVGEDRDPVPATTSWWQAPAADVPVTLRTYGSRGARGRSGRREDYSAAKRRRLLEREAAERRHREALAELSLLRPGQRELRVSEQARDALLDLYAQAVTSGRAVSSGRDLSVSVHRTPGSSTVIDSPSGRLELLDLRVEVHPASRTPVPVEVAAPVGVMPVGVAVAAAPVEQAVGV